MTSVGIQYESPLLLIVPLGVDNNQILLFITHLSFWNVYSILPIPKKRDASDLKYILTNITYEILFQHFIYRIQIFIFAVSLGNGELENFFWLCKQIFNLPHILLFTLRRNSHWLYRNSTDNSGHHGHRYLQSQIPNWVSFR